MTNGNDLASPTLDYKFDGSIGGHPIYSLDGGLTKREYFAACALQGIVANEHFFGDTFQQSPQGAAEFAVETADFLITALNKGA